MSSVQALAGMAESSGLKPLLDMDQSILEAIPAALYICSADGVVVRFNRRATELWGRTPRSGDSDERFCGAFRLYQLDGTPLAHASTPMEAALRTGEPQRGLEVVIERPDGSRVDVLVNIEALKDRRGKVEGAINCFEDISARKRADRELQAARTALRSSEQQSRAVLGALPAALYTTDAEGRLTYYNEAAAQLWGCKPELGTSTWCGSWKLYRPDGSPLPHDACPMALALKERRPIRDMEAVAERPDGVRIPFLAFPTPIFDDSGAMTGAVNMLVDISERKQSETALQRLAEAAQKEIEQRRRTEEDAFRLAAIVSSSDDAIASKDLNGILTSWNRGAERLFGYSAEEVIGKPVTILIPLDHIDEEPGILARIRRGERIDHYETVRRRKDGSLVDISLTVSPIRDRDGKIIGASKIARDITERKRADASLAKHLDELAALYGLTDRLHRARSLAEMYEAALDAIQRALPCRRASILLLDEAGEMRFTAWRGLSDDYRQAVEGHSPWKADEPDPQPICIADVERAELPEALRATVQAEGIGALAFIPLVTGGKLVGKFMTYYEGPHAYSDGEIELALAIARQLGFGVERIRAQDDLRQKEEHERARAAELQAIMEAVPAVIWITREPEAREIIGNNAAHEFLRLPQHANLSLSAPETERPSHFQVLVDNRPLEPEELPVQRAARGEEVHNFEEEVRFDDGTSLHLLGNATPLRDAEGRPSGAVAAFVDITGRKRAEQQRDLLVAELSHRVKNTLATVISIARQSFSRSTDIDEAQQTFHSRIRALAQTHSRLAETNWSGVSLETMLLDEFAPYGGEGGANVRLSGPTVALNARCAVTLGMAMHEMVTNAAKYGALSAKDGVVEVMWEIDAGARTLSIRWSESGGPPVMAPKGSGFGRLLLERALASDLNGKVRMDFARQGLQCAISLPLHECTAHMP